MNIRLCLLGLPGSGKTTIAEKLVEKLNIPLYDVGAILRSRGSSDIHIVSIHKEGGLVNSDRVLGIFEEALGEDNFLLCGSPRKENEARFILENSKWKTNPGWLVYLELDSETATNRLLGRGRFDDLNSEVLAKRFLDFEEQTKKSIACFEKLGRILIIDGTKQPTIIVEEILNFLEKQNARTQQ